MVGALLSAVPGASAAFEGGVIVYTGEAKTRLLGVPESMLDAHGAVSAPVAKAMACGVREYLRTDVGISVTGLIGSPAEGKPAGLTYVAAAGPGDETRLVELADDSGPARNREEAVRTAIRLGTEVASAVPAKTEPGGAR